MIKIPLVVASLIFLATAAAAVSFPKAPSAAANSAKSSIDAVDSNGYVDSVTLTDCKTAKRGFVARNTLPPSQRQKVLNECDRLAEAVAHRR